MLVMMVAAADANKTPSILPEQSNDLADFHASRMHRYVAFSVVESLRTVPYFRFARRERTQPAGRDASFGDGTSTASRRSDIANG